MARRRKAVRRAITPDPVFGSVEVARFTNKVMIGGKRTTAQRIIYAALREAENVVHRPGIEVFQQALRNATPAMEVKPRRVGVATYEVPTEVRRERQLALGMRWLVQAARARSGRPMAERLAQEFIDASRGQGNAVRRKEEIHRMAEANRAFVHYRW